MLVRKLQGLLLAVVLVVGCAGCRSGVDARKAGGAEIWPKTPALLCADQADNRIRLINPFAAGDRKPALWSYPAEDEDQLKYRPTDAKRVEMDGVVYVLAAYHGRVQLVRFKDRKLVKDFPTYGSCHSAELLPNGAIVTANSTPHGMLRLHRSTDDFVDLKLPYAHGVTWDKDRKCLWALGDFLYRIDFAEGKLTIKKKFELPLSPTGHDLFPLRQEAKLLVSNNSALFLFDIATEKFETLSELGGIKSASQHVDGTIWITDPAKLKGRASWQTDAVLRVRPKAPEIRYRNAGSKFYKARWWQKVNFSY
jgi:hypothetical protein